MEEVEELEPNYEVQVFRKEETYCIDSYYTYADDSEIALAEAKEHFQDKFPESEYDYIVEYHGSLQSDRGYEMEVDRTLYLN